MFPKNEPRISGSRKKKTEEQGGEIASRSQEVPAYLTQVLLPMGHFATQSMHQLTIFG